MSVNFGRIRSEACKDEIFNEVTQAFSDVVRRSVEVYTVIRYPFLAKCSPRSPDKAAV